MTSRSAPEAPLYQTDSADTVRVRLGVGLAVGFTCQAVGLYGGLLGEPLALLFIPVGMLGILWTFLQVPLRYLLYSDRLDVKFAFTTWSIPLSSMRIAGDEPSGTGWLSYFGLNLGAPFAKNTRLRIDAPAPWYFVSSAYDTVISAYNHEKLIAALERQLNPAAPVAPMESHFETEPTDGT